MNTEKKQTLPNIKVGDRVSVKYTGYNMSPRVGTVVENSAKWCVVKTDEEPMLVWNSTHKDGRPSKPRIEEKFLYIFGERLPQTLTVTKC